MTLLHHFSHQTCSIYWMVTIFMVTVSDNQYHIYFINAMLGHSWKVIIFSHSCTINICQANKSKRRKNNLDKYIEPLPWLIVMNVTNWFVKFVISRNNDELFRRYSGLKNFLHPQVSVHPHEISRHSGLISTEHTNVSIVKLLRFVFKYWMRLVIYTRTKNIIYHLVGRNNLIYNGYLWNIIEKQQHCVFNTTHECKLWMMNLQRYSCKFHILSSIKHDYIW